MAQIYDAEAGKHLEMLLSGCEEHLAAIRDQLVPEVDVKLRLFLEDVPEDVRAALLFRELAPHRIHDIGAAFLELAQRARVVPAAALGRALGETAAYLALFTFELGKEIDEQEGRGATRSSVRRFLLASRIAMSADLQPPQILDAIDHVAKHHVRQFRKLYDHLSEVVHPNSPGLLGSYATLGEAPGDRPRLGPPESITEAPLAASVLIFVERSLALSRAITQQLDLLLPTLVREADNLPPGYYESANFRLERLLAAIDPRENPEAYAKVVHQQSHLQIRLSGHQPSDARLRAVVGDHEKALRLVSRDAHPETWGALQHCLGVLLLESDRNGLRRAVRIFEKALKVRRKRRNPEAWAATTSMMGVALLYLGGDELENTNVLRARKCLEDARSVYSRKSHSLVWAANELNLGNALIELGERAFDSGLLREALSCLSRALGEFGRRSPHDRALVHLARGSALSALGAVERDRALLGKAQRAFGASLQQLGDGPKPLAARVRFGQLVMYRRHAQLDRSRRSLLRASRQADHEALGLLRSLRDAITTERYHLALLKTALCGGKDAAELTALREELDGRRMRHRSPFLWRRVHQLSKGSDSLWEPLQ